MKQLHHNQSIKEAKSLLNHLNSHKLICHILRISALIGIFRIILSFHKQLDTKLKNKICMLNYLLIQNKN